MLDPYEDPHSGYRPDLDKFGHADHDSVSAAGWVIPVLLICAGAGFIIGIIIAVVL